MNRKLNQTLALSGVFFIFGRVPPGQALRFNLFEDFRFHPSRERGFQNLISDFRV